MISGIAASALLLSPPTPLLLVIFAAVYGAAFSAVVSIGPWLAELYPPELRTAATSMFQWGRFISLLGTSRDWKCRRLLGAARRDGAIGRGLCAGSGNLVPPARNACPPSRAEPRETVRRRVDVRRGTGHQLGDEPTG